MEMDGKMNEQESGRINVDKMTFYTNTKQQNRMTKIAR